MPAVSTATFARPTPFPEDLGQVLWEERRTTPVAAFLGVPTVFLAVLALTVAPPVARLALGLAAVVTAGLLVRAWRRSLIETYVVSTRYVAVLQPAGGRAALPLASITHVTVVGDSVRVAGTAGVLKLGFVRHRRALLKALQGTAPWLVVDHDLTAFCPT
jgi:hypothetical protein